MEKLPKKLYCSDCKKNTLHSPKLDAVKAGNLVCDICSKENPINAPNYKLVRTQDNLTKYSGEVGFIEWNSDGKAVKINKGIDSIKIGTSCIMSPFNYFFTWQTTEIENIFPGKTKNSIKFNTKNSEYVLYDISKN
jgi:hypothetical protein